MRRGLLVLGVLALLLLLIASSAPWWLAVFTADDAAPGEDPGLLGAAGEKDPDAAMPGPTLEGNPDAVAPGPRPVPVRVRVVDRGGHPIPYAGVELRRPTGSIQMADSDANGVAVFRDVPIDGTCVVHVAMGMPPSAEGSAFGREVYAIRRYQAIPGGPTAFRGVPVERAEVVVRVLSGCAYTVDVVEAHTGRRAAGAGVRWIGDRSVAEGVALRPPARFTLTRPAGLWKGPSLDELIIEPPRGLALWCVPAFAARASRLAHEMHLVVPLYPSATMTVAVKLPDPRPFTPELAAAYVAGKPCPIRARPDAHGALHLTRVPHLPGARYRLVIVDKRDPRWWVEARGVLSSDRHPSEPVSVTLGLHEEPPTLPSSHAWAAASNPYRDPVQPRRGPGRATLLVRARTRDGRPAPGVQVRVGRVAELGSIDWWASAGGETDNDGIVRFKGLRAGEMGLDARAAGFLASYRTVTLPSQGLHEVTVTPGKGGTIAVEVVDGEGRGLPFASVRVDPSEHNAYVDLRGDVQRLDPFTDHAGRRTFEHVGVGEAEVAVRWLGRRQTATTTVVVGQTSRVRIVFPDE